VDQVPADVITYEDNGESPFDDLKSWLKGVELIGHWNKDLNERL
jgi:hypothetical protein